jgi:carbonic anhydrase
MSTADEALAQLKEGNHRFVAGSRRLDIGLSHAERAAAVRNLNPFAIILGCSDARVPAEVVFDQGLGDLFVIRVAGNIVSPSQVGSVEFAAQRFGTQLVVVLGHTQCGAILATLEAVRDQANHPENVLTIVERIRPSVQTLLELRPRATEEELVHHAVRANVRASVDHLRHGSALLEDLIRRGRLAVVGAEYSLETGQVEFFETHR